MTLGKVVDDTEGTLQIDRIIDQYEANGWPIDESKLNPLWPESEFYFRVWSDLRDEPRSHPMAKTPWTAIRAYAAAHHELDGLDRLVRMVWALDNRMLEIETEKRKIEEEQARRDRSNHQNRPRSVWR